MCTVTFIQTKESFCITSNRDENIKRPKALPPQEYNHNGKTITFPKDPLAGGTWIAHDDKQVVVLLNGAEEKHQWNPPYRKSRGLILLDVMKGTSLLDNWNTINLSDIEPFTLIYFNGEVLYQLRWNGNKKEQKELSTNKPHIWSSSTLYSKAIQEIRKQWFQNFLIHQKEITPKALFDFHQNTHTENTDYGLQIHRSNGLKTVSITQIVINRNTIAMHYSELCHEKNKISLS